MDRASVPGSTCHEQLEHLMDTHGTPRSLQGGDMGRAVDAFGHAGNHGHTGRRKAFPEKRGHGNAFTRGVAGTDDPDAGSVQQRSVTFIIEDQGSVSHGRERGGIAGAAEKNEGPPVFAQAVPFRPGRYAPLFLGEGLGDAQGNKLVFGPHAGPLQTAQQLGLSRQVLQYKLRKLK